MTTSTLSAAQLKARSSANMSATIAKAFIWVWLGLSLVYFGIQVTNVPEDITGGIWAILLLGAGLATGIVACFMLAVVNYIIYRTTPD
jgi:hypothetical protein